MCGIWALFGSDGKLMQQAFACLKIQHRGPDASCIETMYNFKKCCLGFHHLAIVDTYGIQPIRADAIPDVWCIYNGEIYNYELLQKEFGFKYESMSDGECIVHLYNEGNKREEGKGAEFAAQHLDGVFAFIIVDVARRKIVIGRDTVGIRPAFKLMMDGGVLAICSEVKGLMDLVKEGSGDKVHPVLPGTVETYNMDLKGTVTHEVTTLFHKVEDKPVYKTVSEPLVDDVLINIRNLLKAAVMKRMMSNRRIGCLLSGGLDSSLTTALMVECAKELGVEYPVQTFCVGMAEGPDIDCARRVSEHLKTEHYEILFSEEDAISYLEEVIYTLESYDIVMIRGSLCQYIMSKYIKEKTDSVVIFSGEGADEIALGYVWFYTAPSPKIAELEGVRLLEDLYLHGVLRNDRTTSAHGLEIRVPYLDHEFMWYYLTLDPKIKWPNNGGCEKYLLRKAFSGTNLIPEDILWRPKEGFSDGAAPAGKPLYQVFQDYAETQVNDADFSRAKEIYPYNTPFTKEAFLYRRIFEKYYPGNPHLLPYYWMPKWMDAKDPSNRRMRLRIKEQAAQKAKEAEKQKS